MPSDPSTEMAKPLSDLSHRRPGRRGPDFLCVGPEKTGTSWLYACLASNADVFLPPVKEIRFFYEEVTYPNERWWSRFSTEGDWHARDHRAYLRERARRYVARPHRVVTEWERFVWDWRFLFGSRTSEWYLSLFQRAGGCLAGDISPQYFSLAEGQLRRIRELLPDVKVILLLRDPIDWSWSFARMTVIGDREPETIPDSEFLAFFERSMGYYPTLTAVDRWRRHFPPAQMHVGFYDLLCESPSAFYREICDFLGVDPTRTPTGEVPDLSRRRNEGRRIPLPHRFARHLALQWSGEVERLCGAFSPYPQRWRERLSRLLADETGS